MPDKKTNPKGTDILSFGKFLPLVFTAALAHLAPAATHYVDLNSTNATPPYTNWATAATNIQAAVDVAASQDEIVVTNGIYETGGNTYNGMTNRVRAFQTITLRSVNGPAFTAIRGYQVPGTTNGNAAVRCVMLVSGGTITGFTLTNGATLAVNSPVGAGGGIFCYLTTTISNCVITGNAAQNAGGGVYCSSGATATLTSCTISSNFCYGNGGGIYAGTCSNCTFIGNSAREGGGAAISVLNKCVLIGNVASNGTSLALGGGASGGTLNNCLIVQNSAYWGGGAFGSYITNCTVVSNSAAQGGGWWGPAQVATGPEAVNSIIYYNSASNGPNHYGANLSHCCTTPDPSPPAYVLFSITNAPPLFDQGFRLQSNSPCINAGKNSYVPSATDLGGNTRIAGGTVDIGAYEFQAPTSFLSYGWLQQYGFPTDGSADYADPDGDGMSNFQEWVAGTDPTNGASLLLMLTPLPTNNAAGVTVSWQSVRNLAYFLQRSTNLAMQPPFVTIASNIFASTNTTSYGDTSATNWAPYFFRVGIQ